LRSQPPKIAPNPANATKAKVVIKVFTIISAKNPPL
jgi:hypothetical protein